MAEYQISDFFLLWTVKLENVYIWRNGILLPKFFWPTVRKNCSSDREKLLKFEAEGREFAKFVLSVSASVFGQRPDVFPARYSVSA